MSEVILNSLSPEVVVFLNKLAGNIYSVVVFGCGAIVGIGAALGGLIGWRQGI